MIKFLAAKIFFTSKVLFLKDNPVKTELEKLKGNTIIEEIPFLHGPCAKLYVMVHPGH